MLKSFTIAVLSVFLFLPLAGCDSYTKVFGIDLPRVVAGNGDVTVTQREVDSFTGVRVSGSYRVNLVPGGHGPVIVETDENIQDHVITEVRDNTLYIRTRNETSIRRYTEMNITVNAAVIEDLRTSGSSRITFDGLHQNTLDVRTSGSSRISGTGDVDELSIRSSGSSRIDLAGLTALTADVRSSGSSRISVNASDLVQARTSGSSRVEYTGDPARVDSRSSGSSRVRATR